MWCVRDWSHAEGGHWTEWVCDAYGFSKDVMKLESRCVAELFKMYEELTKKKAYEMISYVGEVWRGKSKYQFLWKMHII